MEDMTMDTATDTDTTFRQLPHSIYWWGVPRNGVVVAQQSVALSGVVRFHGSRLDIKPHNKYSIW